MEIPSSALQEADFFSSVAADLAEITDSVADVFEGAFSAFEGLFCSARRVEIDTSSYAYQQNAYMRLHQTMEHAKLDLVDHLQGFGVPAEEAMNHLSSESFSTLISELKEIGKGQTPGKLLKKFISYYTSKSESHDGAQFERLLELYENLIPDFHIEFEDGETHTERRKKVILHAESLITFYTNSLSEGLAEDRAQAMTAIFLLIFLLSNTNFNQQEGIFNYYSLKELAEDCRKHTFDPDKPSFVIFTHDYLKKGNNYAVYGPSATEEYKKMIKEFSKTHNVVVHQMKSAAEGKRFLQSLKEEHGQRITDVVIAAHGSPTGISISDSEPSANIDFSDEIEDGGHIYLDSCNTAKRTPLSNRPYAELLSEAHPHVSIYASPETVDELTIQFPHEDDRPFVRFTTVRVEDGFEKTERIFAKVFRAGQEVPS